MKITIGFISLIFVYTLFATEISNPKALQAPLILSPSDSSVCFSGDTVCFSCDTGLNFPIDSIVWTSDKDGLLGQSNEIAVWTLSDGEHKITIRMKLRNGSVLTDEIMVIVRPYDSIDVYCTGEIGGAECGGYWINGFLNEVSGTPNSLKKIIVHDGDVYLLQLIYPLGRDTTYYWKNGVHINLPSKIGYSTSDIFISKEGDVYIAGGDYGNNEPIVACYWKNDEKIYLEDTYSIGTNITANKDTVLVSGMYDYKACYWINGIRTMIPDSTSGSQDVFYCNISEDDIYIAGNDNVLYTDMVISLGWYWHNGIKFQLWYDSTAGNPWGRMRLGSFFSDNNDMYALCLYYSEYPFKWYLWKNGIAQPWYDDCSCKALFVRHGHVFVAGSYMLDSTEHLCYWRNGERYDLQGGDQGGEISSIYVVDRPLNSGIKPGEGDRKPPNYHKDIVKNQNSTMYDLKGRVIQEKYPKVENNSSSGVRVRENGERKKKLINIR